MDYFELIQKFSFLNSHSTTLEIITDREIINSWKAEKKRRLAEAGQPLAWAELGIVLDDPYIVMLRDLVRFPNGQLGGYLRLVNRAELEGGQAVVVMAVSAGKVLLLRHFRHATQRWHLEFPRGFGEAGLPAEENVSKEVLEETGGTVTGLADLGWVYCNTGMEAMGVRLFLAQVEHADLPGWEEGIEALRWEPVEEVEKMIGDGRIDDGFSIAAFSRAKYKGGLG